MYTLFEEANTEGLPIVRPMFMEFPEDEGTYALDYQFMFGSDILVAPKTGAPTAAESFESYGVRTIPVYFPAARYWYSYYSKQVINGTSDFIEVTISD